MAVNDLATANRIIARERATTDRFKAWAASEAERLETEARAMVERASALREASRVLENFIRGAEAG